MSIKSVTVQTINFKKMKPEDVFKWLELFSFKRYGERNWIDPKKADDPRYPAEKDQSPPGYYTHLSVPSHYYDQTCVIISEATFLKIKEAFTQCLASTEDQEEQE